LHESGRGELGVVGEVPAGGVDETVEGRGDGALQVLRMEAAGRPLGEELRFLNELERAAVLRGPLDPQPALPRQDDEADRLDDGVALDLLRRAERALEALGDRRRARRYRDAGRR